jgi:hypothetical protein
MFVLFTTTKSTYGVVAGRFASYAEAEAEAKRLWFVPFSEVIATWIEKEEG